MNDIVRGVHFAHPKQPLVLSEKRAKPPVMRVKPQFAEEYPRLPIGGATSSIGYPITKPFSSYAVRQRIGQKRFSDPGRHYSYSQRSSGYQVSSCRRASLNQTRLIPTAGLPINDIQSAPVMPQEPDIVYYGHPELINVPPSNAQFDTAPNRQFLGNDVMEAPLLESNGKDPKYVLGNDVVKEEDFVSSSNIFKLRQLMRVQQKLILTSLGMLVLVIIVLIIILAVLMHS